MTALSASFSPVTNRSSSVGLRMILLLVAILIGLAASAAEAKGVRVRGYYRSNGTYVMPHSRTSPDRTPLNNYGFPGNYNPNTGAISGGDPDVYLVRLCARGSATACQLLFRAP